ncbi:zinc-binding dehydrogenase [Streptomyces sp. 3MP-14]|uniref:Zinc-binding dehydrogenase n=1 Tax=Streptomyces mimosae TaxID=2586635 RepID=A0A5N6AHG3_9ACTN|nr:MULTISPECIES: zinc-dependent alcohol dehydrogenase family protein [Streptomyces]KAB8167685.1 zinc-binding dehydrogenase [Streptomyces mimosae]KAB8177667.1 zinc-binding dehydrogenase [Streptomyces sp. 3MP-14]
MATHTSDTTPVRTVFFDEIGGPEVLTLREVALAEPGPGEVRVRVDAVGLNRAEALFRSGGYYYPAALPGSRLGYEASGVVESVGAGVTAFAPGDPVLTGPGIEMSAQGVYAERVVLPVDSVVSRPAPLDAVAGAALWLAYSSAYGGLVEVGGLRAGDHVVINAASSGVGVAAVQTAARLGAFPLAVTRTAAKRQRLLDLGAARVIVSDEEDVPEEVRRLTGGRGAELVFDAVGGPGLPELATAATAGGTVVTYGWLGGGTTRMPLNWPLTVHGYNNVEMTSSAERRRRVNAFLAAGVGDGSLQPVVGEVLHGLERIGDAHRLLESNAHIGKIVVTVDHGNG